MSNADYVDGFGVVDANGLNIRTVGPTRVSAMVNWLCTDGGMVMGRCTDEAVKFLFEQKCGDAIVVVVRCYVQGHAMIVPDPSVGPAGQLWFRLYGLFARRLRPTIWRALADLNDAEKAQLDDDAETIIGDFLKENKSLVVRHELTDFAIRVHAEFREDEMFGSKLLPILRVEREDDGSSTIVVQWL